MKNDDIINRLMNDNIVDDIQADIDAELEKSEPDYDKIAELTAQISEITGNSLSDSEIAENISKIYGEYDAQVKRNKVKIFYKCISALSACIVLVLALNAYTMVSFGDNLLTAVVKMTQSGFSIDFSVNNEGSGTETTPTETAPATTIAVADTTVVFDTTIAVAVTTTVDAQMPGGSATSAPTITEFQTETSAVTTAPTFTTTPVPTGENMGYIISENCEKIGIKPCFFNYYPNMKLKEFYHEDTELSADCYFTFSDDDRQLDIIIEQYREAKDIPPVLIPSNQNSYYTISCDIGNAYIFSEDEHITAVFVYNNIVYTITGYNTEFDDMERIIISCSPDKQN